MEVAIIGADDAGYDPITSLADVVRFGLEVNAALADSVDGELAWELVMVVVVTVEDVGLEELGSLVRDAVLTTRVLDSCEAALAEAEERVEGLSNAAEVEDEWTRKDAVDVG